MDPGSVRHHSFVDFLLPLFVPCLQSIKLRGTAPTFYRRLHTLFFSDSTLKAEYEDLLRSPGHRKRGRNSKLSSTEASTSTRTLLKLAEGPVVASSSLSSSAVLASTLQDLPLPVKPTEGELQGWLDIRKNQWRTTKNNTVDENDNKRIQCPAPSPVPLPLSPSPPVVSLSSLSGDVKVERVTRPDEAAIFVVDNFLTENELLYFDERIRGRSLRFERSFVDNMEWNVKENEEEDVVEEEGEEGAGDEEDGDEEGEEDPDGSEDNDEIDKEEDYGKANKKRRIVLDTTHRTSTFVSFRKMQDSKIATLEQRIADMFGCFVPQIEPLQMVRYTPGQFFGVHHDMGEILPDDTAVTPPKSIFVKRRLVTIFIYLNTLDQEQGGATLFPKCNNLRVRPERGRAVIWSNVTSNGQADSRTIHAGEPVIAVPSKDAASQCKYGINVWICEE